jgi:hypothetical protein
MTLSRAQPAASATACLPPAVAAYVRYSEEEPPRPPLEGATATYARPRASFEFVGDYRGLGLQNL